MPSIPLVTELGAKADTFQALLNNTPILSSVAKTLQPQIAASDLFTTADSRIFVRSRPIIPFDQQPSTDLSIVRKVDGFRDVVLMAPKVSVSGQCSIESSRIPLDGVFVGSDDTTEDVYENACSPLLALSVGGASTCVLCYGQTGSGKTFTTSGLMKLFAVDIAPFLQTHTISLCVVEVQSAVNTDLLSNTAVQVMEDPSGEIQLLGASEYRIESPKQMIDLIAVAASQRATKSTGRNEQSSRSHMVVRVKFLPQGVNWAKPGYLFVADLAGSENTADSATHDKSRQMEAKFINSSLMTLKDCIRARAMSGSSDKHLHIPYRQSALTLMLRDCFELAVRRPTKTVVIACISPLLRDARHTIGTLRYASLLAVAPPPVLVSASPDDPNGWNREQALEFLHKASRGRLQNPELVLTEGDGRALVHIPEVEFISRVVATHSNLTEKSAKMIYTEVWKAVVDARTKSRQQLKPSARQTPAPQNYAEWCAAEEVKTGKASPQPVVNAVSPSGKQQGARPSGAAELTRVSSEIVPSKRVAPSQDPCPLPRIAAPRHDLASGRSAPPLAAPSRVPLAGQPTSKQSQHDMHPPSSRPVAVAVEKENNLAKPKPRKVMSKAELEAGWVVE